MECEGGGGDKGSVTAAAGTAQVGGLVDSGIQVVTEVVLVLEMAVAVPAVMVDRTLSVVLLTGIGASKVTAAIIARPVGSGSPFVLLQGIGVGEPSRTAITIRHGMVVANSRSSILRIYMSHGRICRVNCGNNEKMTVIQTQFRSHIHRV